MNDRTHLCDMGNAIHNDVGLHTSHCENIRGYGSMTKRPDAAAQKEEMRWECEHHFHEAPWVLISNPPQAVDICCQCGERRTRMLPDTRPRIPESCGKFHPEKPGRWLYDDGARR